MEALKSVFQQPSQGQQIGQGLDEMNPYRARLMSMGRMLAPSVDMIGAAGNWEQNKINQGMNQQQIDQSNAMNQFNMNRLTSQDAETARLRAEQEALLAKQRADQEAWQGSVRSRIGALATGNRAPISSAGTFVETGAPGDEQAGKLLPMLTPGAPDKVWSDAYGYATAPQAQPMADYNAFFAGLPPQIGNQPNPYYNLDTTNMPETMVKQFADDANKLLGGVFTADANERLERLKVSLNPPSKDGIPPADKAWIDTIDNQYKLVFGSAKPTWNAKKKTWNPNKEDRLTGKMGAYEETGGWEIPPTFQQFEDWTRKTYGNDVWARYAQTKNFFGDSYKGDIGRAILTTGSVEKAAISAYRANDVKLFRQLIERANENRKKAGKRALTEEEWKAYAASQ